MNTQGQVRQRNQANGSWGAWTNYAHSFWIDSSEGVAEGVNTPALLSLLKRGSLLPMTPYYRYDIDRHRATFSMTVSDTAKKYNPFVEYTTNCNYVGLSTLDFNTLGTFVDADQQQYYVQAAAAKIYASGWDTLTFLAELRKTVGMILGLARKVRRLRELELRKEWLELRYGWRTLWYDIEDIVKVLNNIDGERKRYRETAGSTENYTSSLGWSQPDWAYVGLTLHVSYVRTVRVGSRGTVVADIEPPQLRFNPVITAWELVSYSFVVDWLLNISQWIESLSFLALQKQHVAAGGAMVEINDGSATVAVTGNGKLSASVSVSGTTTQTGSLKARYPMSVPSSPQLLLRLDALKVVDLVCLILGIKRR